MNQMRQFIKSILKIPLFRKLVVFWKALTASWRIYLEQPIPVDELGHSREAASIPSFGFFFLLITAAVIATLGLINNSAAVIIGAMIVAPLMNPILSLAFAIVTGNWTLYQRSGITVFLGASAAVLVSYLISSIVPIHVIHEEILARTAPNIIDLGIAIAAGAAGSFSLTRKSIANSIAGVAIAVALVPPLCVVGIGLSIGNDISAEFGKVVISNLQIAEGAFLLFVANFVGITFTACLVFLSQSYGSFQKARKKIFTYAIFIVLLSAPLTNALREFMISSSIDLEIHQIREENPTFWKPSQIRHVSVKLQGRTANVKILVNSPQGLLTNEHLDYVHEQLLDSVSHLGVKDMNLNIRIAPVQIRDYNSNYQSRI